MINMDEISKGVYEMNESFYDDFLYAELNGNQELYRALFNFIVSYEIKNGEFEGNEHVVRKIDLCNFILAKEYTDIENREDKSLRREIHDCIPADRDILIFLMAKYAEKDSDLTPLYEENYQNNS